MADTKVYEIPGGLVYSAREMMEKGRLNFGFPVDQMKLRTKVLNIQKEKCSIARPGVGKEVLFFVRLADEDAFVDPDNLLVGDNFFPLSMCIDSWSNLHVENIPLGVTDGRYQGFWIALPEEQWEKWPDEFSIIG